MTGLNNGRRNPRRTILDVTEEAQSLGYRVREGEPFEAGDYTEIMLDINGHGELLEAYFRRNEQTGYWKFYLGFRHGNVTGDRYWRLNKFRDILQGIAGT